MTASIHLNKIRECDELSSLYKHTELDGLSYKFVNFTVTKIYRGELTSQNIELTKIIVQINDILEEIRRFS